MFYMFNSTYSMKNPQTPLRHVHPLPIRYIIKLHDFIEPYWTIKGTTEI